MLIGALFVLGVVAAIERATRLVDFPSNRPHMKIRREIRKRGKE